MNELPTEWFHTPIYHRTCVAILLTNTSLLLPYKSRPADCEPSRRIFRQDFVFSSKVSLYIELEHSITEELFDDLVYANRTLT